MAKSKSFLDEIREGRPHVDRSGLLLPGDPEFKMRPSGHCIVDGEDVACTIQCVHCGSHWVPVKGSGIQRGFCTRCMGPCCSAKCTMECVPYHKRQSGESLTAVSAGPRTVFGGSVFE